MPALTGLPKGAALNSKVVATFRSNDRATHKRLRVAILTRGDEATKRSITPETSRFSDLLKAFAERGVRAELVIYNDAVCEEVRRQLLETDAVLVWVNPIQHGADRSRLDAMLRQLQEHGVFVSAQPETILKLGTKEVLYRTREIGWGCDTHLYGSLEQMRLELPPRLARGKARVLKQYRGHSGDGVRKIHYPAGVDAGARAPANASVVRVRHARRGCEEEDITLAQFFERCAQYFTGTGRMIDQEYQERLADGMIRCYLVHDRVVGFGHQQINALYPSATGRPAVQAGPRLYYPPGKPEFQKIKRKLEDEWLPEVRNLLEIHTDELPVLWDCDFLFGPRDAGGRDTYVLCEINMSSVAPYPESAVPAVVEATIAQARKHRACR
jgi:hypothetical protein